MSYSIVRRSLWLQACWLLGTVSALCAPADKALQSATKSVPNLPETKQAQVSSVQSATAIGDELKLVARFDQNNNQRLDADERKAALAYLAHPPEKPAPPITRPGQMLLPLALEPVKVGEKITPADTPSFRGQPLYAPGVLRTLFLEFDDPDWERQLIEFANTDVLVPARVTVDGSVYDGVGVHAQPQTATSPYIAGYKRSLELTFDYAQAGQTLGGHRQIQLLASNTDPTFLRPVLYARVAQAYLPAPKANYARVVINGENWGPFVNLQPFDELFLQENFGTTQGARWTVSRGGNLAYLGEDPAAYRRSYQLESPEDSAAWTALIQLCKLIKETPAAEFRETLAPHLDIDSALKFFAVENSLINQDGFGSGTGGFSLYLDPSGRFHLVPQSAEASFRLIQVTEYGARSRGGNGGPRGGKPEGGGAAAKDGKEPAAADPAVKANKPDDFPRQSGTNLAMLLSYSFVSKADSDFNEKVTKDEWLTFARTWFMVMDEDFTGQLTRELFIAKVRGLVTPASITDGRTKQTFGREDAAAVIGQDFFAAMDENYDGRLTREELGNTFARWFENWGDTKSGVLTQAAIQRGLTELFTQSVFQADQTYIASRHNSAQAGPEERGGGARGGGERGGQGGGSGVGFGPIQLGLGGRGGRGEGSRSLITFSEQLDPLAGKDGGNNPLLAKFLAAPGLRVHYLDALRDLAENWLTWTKLGPVAKEYHALIAPEVSRDTHKPTSYVHFVQELDQDTATGPRDGDAAPSLKAFVTERSTYLLKSSALTGRSEEW